MSAKRSQSRRKNFTTTIRRQGSPGPSTSSAHFTSIIGNRVARGRVTSRPSSVHLTPSASASPAPSSISSYSQDVNPPAVEWDLPTEHLCDVSPLLITGKKGRAKVLFPPLLPFLYLISAHSVFLQQEKPMNSWIPMISSFLDEILRRDGPGAQATDGPCNSCAQFSPLFRCTECFSNELLCQACIVGAHAQAPFHSIEVCFLFFLFFSFILSLI